MQQLLACLNFTLDSEDLSFWYKTKNLFLCIIAAAQAAENHGDEWGLTWYFRWGIYTSIPAWTHSLNSQAAAEALSLWNISQLITMTVPISRRIVISNVIKWGIPLLIWWKVNENWYNNMIRIFQWWEKHCRTNTSVRRNK